MKPYLFEVRWILLHIASADANIIESCFTVNRNQSLKFLSKVRLEYWIRKIFWYTFNSSQPCFHGYINNSSLSLSVSSNNCNSREISEIDRIIFVTIGKLIYRRSVSLDHTSPVYRRRDTALACIQINKKDYWQFNYLILSNSLWLDYKLSNDNGKSNCNHRILSWFTPRF